MKFLAPSKMKFHPLLKLLVPLIEALPKCGTTLDDRDAYRVHYKLKYILYLINIFTGSIGWNRQHHGQTIRPTEKLHLFKILWVVTWAWFFWPPWLWRLLEAKTLWWAHTLALLTQSSVNPRVPFLLTKKIRSNLNVHQ